MNLPGQHLVQTRAAAVVRAVAPLLALGVLAALVEADGPTGLRVPAGLAAVLLLPGTTVTSLLRLRPSAARAAFAVGVSLATSMVLSCILVLAGGLTATNTLVGLVLVTAPFSLARVWRAGREAPAPAAAPTTLRLEPGRGTEVGLTALALLLWVVAAIQIDPRAAGDLGMLTALPIAWWLGVAALLVALVLHVRQGIWTPLAVAQTGALITFLFVIMTVSEPYSRIPTSYTHVGLVDYLVRDHEIVRHFDARYSWPGSLSLGAMLTQLSGAASSATFVRWAIPLMVSLWALVVYAAAAAFTCSRSVRWLTVWIFLLLDWVGQDYYSPQAANFFLVMVAITAVATWFPRRVLRGRLDERLQFLPIEQPPGAYRTSAQGVGLLLLLVVIATAVAVSHQLSPFLLFGAMTVLWLVDRRDIRLLPLIVLVVTLAWISFGAWHYWINHFDTITKDVGNVGGVVGAGTAKRLADGTLGRTVVLITRLTVSIGMWLAAAASFWFVVRRRSSSSFTVAALAVAPFGSVALQSYGGELGLRVFLFCLPFGALLLAHAADQLLRREWADPRRAVAVPALAALVLTSAFVLSRYGNEQFEQTYVEDMAAVRAVYDLAPPRALVLTPNTANVLRSGRYKDLQTYRYTNLAAAETVDLKSEMWEIAEIVESIEPLKGYILLTQAGIREAVLRQGANPGWDRALRRQLAGMGGEELFRRGEATVWSYDLLAVPRP